MKTKKNGLGKRVFVTLLSGFIATVILIFLPAGTLDYWQGWLFLSSIFIPMLFVLAYMLKNARGLLEKRLNIKEKRRPQQEIQSINTLLCLAMFFFAGVDRQLGLSLVPVWAVIASDIVMVLAYLLFIKVMIDNEYASRVIEVQKGQKVMDTGAYAIVRHPMYSFGILMFMLVPLVLGSFWALIPILPMPFMMILRIFDEEKALIKGLKGYKQYMKKVKYRLMPFVW